MEVRGSLEIAGVEKLTEDPSTNLFVGRTYWNTASQTLRLYDAGQWITVGSFETAGTIKFESVIDSDLDLSTGVTAETIRYGYLMFPTSVPNDVVRTITLPQITTDEFDQASVKLFSYYYSDLTATTSDGKLFRLPGGATAASITIPPQEYLQVYYDPSVLSGVWVVVETSEDDVANINNTQHISSNLDLTDYYITNAKNNRVSRFDIPVTIVNESPSDGTTITLFDGTSTDAFIDDKQLEIINPTAYTLAVNAFTAQTIRNAYTNVSQASWTLKSQQRLTLIKKTGGYDIVSTSDIYISKIAPGLENFASDAEFETAFAAGESGNIYWNTTDNVIRYYDDDEWRTIGNTGGTVLVAAYAKGVLALPTGTVSIDGRDVEAGNLVCFPDFDLKIYQAVGTGTNITSWLVQDVFKDGSDVPSTGEGVRVQYGESFGLQTAIYNGTAYVVNDKVRYFTGSNFWEQSAIIESALTDNTSLGTVFSVAGLQSENMVIDYSVSRGSDKRLGQLFITHMNVDGSLPITDSSIDTNDLGVSFSAELTGGNVVLQYTTTSTGSGATMKYTLKRWSDAGGGPSSPPSYTPPDSGDDVPAPGDPGQIPYHGGSGNLTANANFSWDDAAGALVLGDLHIKMLSVVTLFDNQVDQIIFTIPVADARHMIMEYSIARGDDSRVGRKIIFSDSGGSIHETEDFVEPVVTGITLSSDILSGDIRFKYSSTATGVNATFKYSIRYWS